MKMHGIFLALCMAIVLISSGCVSTQMRAGTEYAREPTTSTAFPTTSTVRDGYLYFHFSENSTKCAISGSININNISLGTTPTGVMKVMQSEYGELSRGLDVICINGSLVNCDGVYSGWKTSECWETMIPQGYFLQRTGDVITFNSTISLHQPKNYEELMNFVRPYDLISFIDHEREIGMFSGIVDQDLETLWKYVDSHIYYRYDSDTSGMEYWKLPNETLSQGWGDCEDWSNLFVSMARSYNESLKCYSIRLPSHIGAFCKTQTQLARVYAFFDQRTKVKGFSDDESSELSKISEALDSYFSEYQLGKDERNVLYAFNENEYFLFASNEEFVKWASEIQP